MKMFKKMLITALVGAIITIPLTSINVRACTMESEGNYSGDDCTGDISPIGGDTSMVVTVYSDPWDSSNWLETITEYFFGTILTAGY